MVSRMVSLRRRNAVMSPQFRSSDKKLLEQLENGLPRHVTAEADRVIGALAAEIRAVGNSVEAARREILDSQDEICEEVRAVRAELGALYRGDCALNDEANVEEQLSAVSLAQTALTAQKRKLAAQKRVLTAAKKEQRETEPRARLPLPALVRLRPVRLRLPLAKGLRQRPSRSQSERQRPCREWAAKRTLRLRASCP